MTVLLYGELTSGTQAKSASRHRNVEECIHCVTGQDYQSQRHSSGKNMLSSAGIDDLPKLFLFWQPVIDLTGWTNLH